MIQIKHRAPTTAELYPNAYHQDLTKKQAEHFVNKIITKGNIASGYENMLVEFPEAVDNSPLFINTKSPQLYIFSYLKNNWKPLVVVGVGVALIVSIHYNFKQRQDKKITSKKT